MDSINWGELSLEQFLNEYWQKKPLLIKRGLVDFVDPIEPEELAGLAMEECVESRIVSNHQGQWQLTHGPFADFNALGETNSSLLVQAVNHWHPDAATLLDYFQFLPNWRLDDLMISYSTPGGGVGAHIDQYDVFIIQGMGQRRWQVGAVDKSLTQFQAAKDLLQVQGFDPIIDEVLTAGDIIYIPPHAPHAGQTIEETLNYSIGFRAPNVKEMFSAMADHMIDNEIEGPRYQDGELATEVAAGTAAIGEISMTSLARVRQMLSAALADDVLLAKWFGSYVTNPKHDMDLLPQQVDGEAVLQMLNEYEFVAKTGGARLSFSKIGEQVLLFNNGEVYELNSQVLEWVELLCECSGLTTEILKSFTRSLEFVAVFTTLIKEGVWYFVD